jgi:hypothetical protein
MDQKYTHRDDVSIFTRLRRTCVHRGNPHSLANCCVQCHVRVSRWHHCEATGSVEGRELFVAWHFVGYNYSSNDPSERLHVSIK